LFFLQDAAHHLLPEPSITPFPWKMTLFSLEKSSHVRGNFGSQFFGSSGAIIIPSICTQEKHSLMMMMMIITETTNNSYSFLNEDDDENNDI
jgi:hypothetical protein